MKRMILSLLLIFLVVSTASAQVLIGSKATGMGGAGVANVTDLTAAYYNPAGLMKSGNVELLISASPSYTDYQQVLDAFQEATDPASFFITNYSNALAFDGDVTGQVGFSLAKIGVSYIALPLGSAAGDTLPQNNSIYIEKPADSLQATASYATRYDLVLTLGRTFAPAFLPASLDVGVNLKSISALYGIIDADLLAPSSPYTKGTGTGTAIDLGVRTNLDLPLFGSAAVGASVRDLMGKIKYSRTQQTYYFTGTDTITKSAEADLADKEVTLHTPITFGFASNIAAIGLGLAADIEMAKNETITHVGLEYPILARLIILRGGYMTGALTKKTTFGAKVNLPLLTIDAAMVMDSNNTNRKAWTANVGLSI